MLVVIAAITAGAVVFAGGGGAFWLSVPAALLAAGRSPTRRGAALSAAIVTAGAIGAAEFTAHLHPAPSLALMLLVPAASVGVLLAARERLERERDSLRASALSDHLTGIANRRSLLARVEYEIARHGRMRRSFALVMIDLDGFKLLNDRFGHAAGDDLLCDVAAALARTVRAQDTAARIGGDEFCVLAPETDESGTGQLLARVQRAVGGVTAGIDAVRASAGLSVFPADGTSVETLLHTADQRLLAAKRERGRGRAQRRAA